MTSYEIAMLTEEQMYAMVKNLKITMKEFMYWCNFQTELAEWEGRENMERYYENA